MVNTTVNSEKWTVHSTVRSGKCRARRKQEILFLLLLALPCSLSAALAQQPQAQAGQEINPYNAKYVQGVGPGYWPTAGPTLTLNLAAGTAVCGNVVQTYAGGTLTLAPNATNYVYLNTANNCAGVEYNRVYFHRHPHRDRGHYQHGSILRQRRAHDVCFEWSNNFGDGDQRWNDG